ncbi:MAG: 3-isopropylmalate dehydratase large subunit [Vulcanimicrobiaceae bacterium]
MSEKTYFDGVWDAHVVEHLPDGNDLLFIDRVIAHEITTPPAVLEIDREFGGELFDPSGIVAVNDHVSPAKDAATAEQAQFLRAWAKRNAIALFDIGDNGICHVLAPERGLVMPGATLCCGDSHTCTLGALGALAIGVGSTVQGGAMLSGCAVLKRPKVMNVEISGERRPGVSAKDVALWVVRRIGVAGATGFALEYSGSTVAALTMDERLTLCNMAIEAGATTAIVKPDETTAAYLANAGVAASNFERWLRYDCADERFDATVAIDAQTIAPLVTWGTNPGQSIALGDLIPADANPQALAYMGLEAGSSLTDRAIDQVFIGSCTNSRIGDLRDAAAILRGRRVCVPTIVTPGSQRVKRAAEREGLHDLFQDAGALWTHASCGPCLGMSMGVLARGARCVSTSNRNFPGRMGTGGRVHLASPAVAAASAVLGHIPSTAELRELTEVVACA